MQIARLSETSPSILPLSSDGIVDDGFAEHPAEPDDIGLLVVRLLVTRASLVELLERQPGVLEGLGESSVGTPKRFDRLDGDLALPELVTIEQAEEPGAGLRAEKSQPHQEDEEGRAGEPEAPAEAAVRNRAGSARRCVGTMIAALPPPPRRGHHPDAEQPTPPH